jgi:aspartate racemase
MSTIESFLSARHAKGVRLWVEDGQLRYRAPKGALAADELDEIRTRKAELVAYLERTPSVAHLPPFVPQPRTGGPVPLSHGQERMWSPERGTAAAASPCALLGFAAVRLRGAVDLSVLERCLAALAARHEALRTHIPLVDARPVQAIGDAAATAGLECVDLSALPEEEREEEVRRRAVAMLRAPIDLAAGPPFRVCAFRLDAADHVVVLWLHHLIGDAWSVAVLRRELAVLYAAFTQGRPSPLSPLPVQFADYVLWKRRSLDAILRLHLPYWQAHLAGAPPLVVPTDRPRTTAARGDCEGAPFSFALPREPIARLHDLGRQEAATQFMVLFAAFQVLLSAWSSQEDIVVGVVGARAMAEVQSVVGFCANYAPTRTDLAGASSFRELLRRVKRTSLEANEHYYPHIENLPEILRPEQPFCRVQFHLNPSALRPPTGPERTGFADAGIPEAEFHLELPRYALYEDLILTLLDGPDGGMRGWVTYRPDLFHAATIERFVAGYRTCLDEIGADPDQPLADLTARARGARRV